MSVFNPQMYTWKKSYASRKVLQGCIINYNLSIVYFLLIKIIFGNMIRGIQRYFYVKTTEIHQSIWQIAAMLASEIFLLLLRRHSYFLQLNSSVRSECVEFTHEIG